VRDSRATRPTEAPPMAPALAPPALFRVGAAKVDITPPLGVSLAGYFHDRRAARIRDGLFARAVVIGPPSGSAAESIALVSVDLCSVEGDLVAGAREKVAAALGIPFERVLVSATHTHTGPELRHDSIVPRSDEWADSLPGCIAEAVIEAHGRARVATLRAGRTTAEGYAHNRLSRLADGSEVFGLWGHEGRVIGPAGPVDAEMVTLGAVDESGETIALVVNFPLHVDVIGGGAADFVSADWPGGLCNALARVHGEHTVALFLQGAAGDINHVPNHPTHLPVGGPADACRIARGLAGAALLASERAEPMADGTLAAVIDELAVPYYTREPAFMAEIAALKARPELGYFDQYTIERAESWPHDGELARVPVQCIRIGEVALVAMPAEVFTGIGLTIKHWSPAAYTMPVTLANDRASTYIPTTDQAERGAYGAKPILSRWLCADAGRRIADASQVALGKLFAPREG
jgi:neutral ceramidase